MILRELFNYALYKFVKNTYNNYLIIKSNNLTNKINNKTNKYPNKINNSFKNKLLFNYNVKQIKYGNNYTK
jgi:hypothetical protein